MRVLVSVKTSAEINILPLYDTDLFIFNGEDFPSHKYSVAGWLQSLKW